MVISYLILNLLTEFDKLGHYVIIAKQKGHSGPLEMKDWCWIAIVILLIMLTLMAVTIAFAQTPPSVTTNAATGSTYNSTTLNGNLTSMGDALSVNVSFQWANETYYSTWGNYSDETTPISMGLIGTFNDSINGLDPSTTYHFRAKAVGNVTAYGFDMNFTTGALPSAILPSVTTNAATSITYNSATLNGNLTSMGDALSVNVSFQWTNETYYSTWGNYSDETTPILMGAIGSFSDSIIGLVPSTTYHFRAKAVGNSTVYGDDLTFSSAEQLQLQGWGWCTNCNNVAAVTFDGYTTMVERAGDSNSYSMHALGNLTLLAPYNETIPLDMYGSRVRSLLYLRQEITGKSATFEGTWINSDGNQTYSSMIGTVALPNPEGTVLKTARVCSVYLRTPDVEVPLIEPGSFVDDLESMLSRYVKLVDKVIDSLVGTGFGGILSNILTKIAVLLAHLRALGTPYIS